MNIRSKRLAGIVVAIIGIVLIIYSVYSMNRISEGKAEVHSLTGPFSGSASGRVVGEALGNRASQYDSTVLFLLISGIVLTAAGAGVVFVFRKK